MVDPDNLVSTSVLYIFRERERGKLKFIGMDIGVSRVGLNRIERGRAPELLCSFWSLSHVLTVM